MRTRQTTAHRASPPHCRRSWTRCARAQIRTLCAALLLATSAGSASASDANLVLLPDWTGILPLLIALFVVLVFPANALLFKPIFRILDERENRTSGTRKRAEKIMHDARETLEKYERAIRDVREQAEHDRKSHIATARAENAALTAAAREQAQSQAERAGRELAEALDESRAIMREQAESIATEAAARVLGRPL